MEILPPTCLKSPLNVPSKTLMGPGPSNCPPRVLHALSQPILGHLHLETLKIMDEIKDGIRYIFQTKNPLTLAVSASGHGGMEAVLCNLLEPGDTALIAINGIWGQRASDMAERYGANVVKLETEPGQTFTLASIENAITQYKPNVFFITQGESSTGIYQNIEGIGDICRRNQCFLAVDTVASLGAVPMFVDKWNVDAIYTGTQKVLSAPTGLAPISFSPRAQNHIMNRKTPIKVYYWDMTVLGDYWGCYGRPRIYHHTISSQLLYGLREALALVAEEGLENVLKRHHECATQLYKGIERLRLQLYVEEEHKRLPTVTAIKIPNYLRKNWRSVISYAMNNYSVEISGGLGPTTGEIFRFGLMGYNATPEKVDFLLRVFEEALTSVRKGNSQSKL